MCIYFVWEVILFLLYAVNLKNKDDNKNLFIISAVFLTFLMAFKDSSVSPDTPEYVNFYLNKFSIYGSVAQPNDIEPGLGWICKILWILPKWDFIFIFTTTLLTMIPVFRGISAYSENKIASVLLIMIVPGIWLVQMITLRQALAQAFLLMALYWFLERKEKWWIKTLISIVISFFFHSSPFLIIPLSLLAIFLPVRDKRYVYVALVLSLLIAGTFSNMLGQLFNSYFGAFQGLDRVTTYIENDTYGETGFSFFNYAPMTFFAGFLTYCCDVNSKKWIFVKLFVLGIIVYNILGNIPLVDRSIAFLLVAGIIGGLPSRKQCTLCMALFLLYLIQRTYVHYEAGTPFQPYKFIFE